MINKINLFTGLVQRYVTPIIVGGVISLFIAQWTYLTVKHNGELKTQAESFTTKVEHERIKAELIEERKLSKFYAERNSENNRISKEYEKIISDLRTDQFQNELKFEDLDDEIQELLSKSPDLPTVGDLGLKLRD